MSKHFKTLKNPEKAVLRLMIWTFYISMIGGVLGCSGDESSSAAKAAIMSSGVISIKFAPDLKASYQGVLESKYWNLISKLGKPFSSSDPLESKLKDSAGNQTDVVIKADEAWGSWANDSNNELMKTYGYPLSNLEFKNLSAGKYKILLYACEGKDRRQTFTLETKSPKGESVSKTDEQSPTCSSAEWQEPLKLNVHYVAFEVTISEGESISVVKTSGDEYYDYYDYINAIQIQKITGEDPRKLEAVQYGSALFSIKLAADANVTEPGTSTYSGAMASQFWNLILSGMDRPPEVKLKDSAGNETTTILKMTIDGFIGGWGNDSIHNLMKSYAYGLSRLEFNNLPAGKYRILIYACESKDRSQSLFLSKSRADGSLVSSTNPQTATCASKDWNADLKLNSHYMQFDMDVVEGETIFSDLGTIMKINAIQIEKLNP